MNFWTLGWASTVISRPWRRSTLLKQWWKATTPRHGSLKQWWKAIMPRHGQLLCPAVPMKISHYTVAALALHTPFYWWCSRGNILCSSLGWPDTVPYWEGGLRRAWPQSRFSITKSSHAVSNNYHQRLTLLHWCFQFLLCPSSWTKTDLTPGSLTPKHHINHILQTTCHWTLHWYTLHGAGNKLPYSHVPDPFPRCGTGSSHTRLLFHVCPLWLDHMLASI